MKSPVLICFVLLASMGSLAFSATMRDPTMPVDSNFIQNESVFSSDLILKSTLVSSVRHLATINGKVVKVGDLIGGAKVKSISPGEVLLVMNGSSIKLEVTPQMIRGYKK